MSPKRGKCQWRSSCRARVSVTFLAFDQAYKSLGPQRILVVGGTVHGLGWLFLALASGIAPRTWQDKPAGASGCAGNASAAGATATPPNAPSFATLARPERLLLARVPSAFKPVLVWAVLALLAGGWAWGLANYQSRMAELVASTLPRHLAQPDHESLDRLGGGAAIGRRSDHGALELLLSTPLTVQEVLRGQLLALKRQFLGPLVVVLTAFFIFMMAAASEMTADEDRISWILFWMALMGLMVADLAGLYWVGMWQGLTAKNPNRATEREPGPHHGRALGRVCRGEPPVIAGFL